MELRAWRMEDREELTRLADSPKIAKNLKDVFPNPYTAADAERFLTFCRDTPEDQALNRAILVEGRLVGCVGLTFGTDIYTGSAEIGYWLGEDCWGRGIAAEAVREMCRLAFEELGLWRVWAAVFSANAASCRVLETCGFTLEGTLKSAAVKGGERMDVKLYGLVKEEMKNS